MAAGNQGNTGLPPDVFVSQTRGQRPIGGWLTGVSPPAPEFAGRPERPVGDWLLGKPKPYDASADIDTFEQNGKPLGPPLSGAEARRAQGLGPVGKWLGGDREEIEPSALQAYFDDLDRPEKQIAREKLGSVAPTADEASKMWSQGRAGKAPWAAPSGPEMQLARSPAAGAVENEHAGWERGRSAASPTLDVSQPLGVRIAPYNGPSLREAIAQAAPLDGGGTVPREVAPDTLEYAKDPWAWMERKGYVAPPGVDLQKRATAAREDVDRARLGLAKDWVESEEGSREMQSRLAGETTPTHVWDRGAPAAPPAQELYAQQYAAMPKYGIPGGGGAPGGQQGVQLLAPRLRSDAEWADIKAGRGSYEDQAGQARAEFRARSDRGETPEQILASEQYAREQRVVPPESSTDKFIRGFGRGMAHLPPEEQPAKQQQPPIRGRQPWFKRSPLTWGASEQQEADASRRSQEYAGRR